MLPRIFAPALVFSRAQCKFRFLGVRAPPRGGLLGGEYFRTTMPLRKEGV